MSKEKYEELIDELYETLGVEPTESMYELSNLRINEIDFSIMHGNFIDNDILLIYCDLGKPPAETKELILERMMEITMQAVNRSGPEFGCNPETEHLLLMHKLHLSETNLDELMINLAQSVGFAHSWKAEALIPLDVLTQNNSKEQKQVFNN